MILPKKQQNLTRFKVIVVFHTSYPRIDALTRVTWQLEDDHLRLDRLEKRSLSILGSITRSGRSRERLKRPDN
jgi:hypothetical protein